MSLKSCGVAAFISATKLHLLPLVWGFNLGKGWYGAQGAALLLAAGIDYIGWGRSVIATHVFKILARELTERPHASGVAASMSAHSKTPHIALVRIFLWEWGSMW